jgi:hypothetical protein
MSGPTGILTTRIGALIGMDLIVSGATTRTSNALARVLRTKNRVSRVWLQSLCEFTKGWSSSIYFFLMIVGRHPSCLRVVENQYTTMERIGRFQSVVKRGLMTACYNEMKRLVRSSLFFCFRLLLPQ